MQHLFSIWPELSVRLSSASHIFLLCDYDGTITPIVKRPELAVLAPEMRRLLQRLAEHSKYTVSIVTGRSLKDIVERVSLSEVIYVGNHGLEIEGPGIHYLHPVAKEIRPLLVELDRELARAMASIPGVIVENKGLTISVHYRLVEEARIRDLQAAFEDIVKPLQLQGKIRTGEGKRLLEIRPAVDWDKGKAVALILERCGQGHGAGDVLAAYLGDDRTDEDAFRAVNQQRGLSIYVGDQGANSEARYYLTSPAEVQEFLERLASMS